MILLIVQDVAVKMTILKAPKGKVRVVGVDTFDNTDWIIGDYMTEQEAIDVAELEGQRMLKTHVYNDNGKHLFSAGSF